VDNAPCLAVASERDCESKYLKCNYPQCKIMVTNDEKCQAKQHDVRGYYSAGIPNKAYLPLGPRLDSWTSSHKIQSSPQFFFQPPSKRQFAFNAIFSQNTDMGRQVLARIIEEQHGKSNLTIFKTMAEIWTQKVNSPHTQQLHTDSYMEVLLDSVFTLAPAGHNPECFRLFEAVEAGSIPVLVKGDLHKKSSFHNSQCKEALHHWYDAPMLVLDSWRDLFPTVERLMGDHEALDEMQVKLRTWYDEYMHSVVGGFEDFMLEAAIEEKSVCDDILLFVPDIHGSLGSQLNDYILAATLATFRNKAMVILDAPQELICPTEDKVYPLGLSSIVKSPTWLTRGCAVPCQATHGYSDWGGVLQSDLNVDPVTVCENDGRRVNVFVVGGDEIHGVFEKHVKDITLQPRPSSVAYDWAVRVGAEPQEATMFSKLEGETMWDYLGALLIRSNVLRFQPLIANDVEEYIKKYIFPFQSGLSEVSYDAIQIRRGADVLADPEAARLITFNWDYWEKRGYYNQETLTKSRKYIPLPHYLRHYNSLHCRTKVHQVYIATDDPVGVKREIAQFPKSDEGTILNDCQVFKFTVSEVNNNLGTGGCADRYDNAIVSIADFVVLRNADTFVGEFHSDWGKLIRTFRLMLKAGQRLGLGGVDQGPVLLKDTKVAWGRLHPGPPGW